MSKVAWHKSEWQGASLWDKAAAASKSGRREIKVTRQVVVLESWTSASATVALDQKRDKPNRGGNVKSLFICLNKLSQKNCSSIRMLQKNTRYPEPGRRAHTSPVLASSQPAMEYTIKFKNCLITYMALHSQSPAYICECSTGRALGSYNQGFMAVP